MTILLRFCILMISNLSNASSENTPQCRRKALAGNLIKKNLIPTKFEYFIEFKWNIFVVPDGCFPYFPTSPLYDPGDVTLPRVSVLSFRENRFGTQKQPSTFASPCMYVACLSYAFGTQSG
ncbi:hypothetical protein CEXT_238821 [Caerostris extrusa]|uniref:Secreted protein n=1 Tax=Caerostris extrusa TaxID=172846 RepID=A0AAV4PKQ1_CAEEX|nr:hypothetical protein CEXT_238821 [Caerostris extrusa]